MVQIGGSTAVVVGGQRGLGKAIVDELLERGAAKVYSTALAPEPIANPRVLSIALDVTDPDSVVALAGTAVDTSIVVNSDLTVSHGSVLTTDIDIIRSEFDTNYFGALRLARAFAPVLHRNNGGALVGVHAAPPWTPEFGEGGDSKAALWAATISLREQLRAQNTLVIGVVVGYRDTETEDHQGPQAASKKLGEVAVQIAEAIVGNRTGVLAPNVERTSPETGPPDDLEGFTDFEAGDL